MPQNEMLLFCGRNRIRYGYARWGYTRGGGKTWHGGADVEGLDDTTIRMPGYGLGAGRHAISGTVVTARRVAQSTGNPTWEWGWYVCVKLDANQTPDAVNYLYFCHNAKNLAAVGQRVKTGRNGQHRQRGAGQPALCALPLRGAGHGHGQGAEPRAVHGL